MVLRVRYYWHCLRNFNGKPQVLTALAGSLNTVFKHLQFCTEMLKSAKLALHAKKPCMLISEPSGIPTSVFRTVLVPNVLAEVGLILSSKYYL